MKGKAVETGGNQVDLLTALIHLVSSMQEDSNLVVEDINSHKPHNNASLVVPTVETTKTVSPRNLPVCPVDEHR